MDLQELSSALPKPWLTINTGRLNSALYTAPVLTSTATPLTLTAAQIVNGVVAFSTSGAQAVTMPSTASLTAYFVGSGLQVNDNFYVDLYSINGNVATITLNGPVSMTGASTIYIVGITAGTGAVTYKRLTYSWNGTAWIVYG